MTRLPNQKLSNEGHEWFFAFFPYNELRVDLRGLESQLGADSDVSVLFTDDARRPLVVTNSYGFGRVTLVGLDIFQSALARAGLPNMSDRFENRLWGGIFGWRSKGLSSARVETIKQKNYYIARPNCFGRLYPVLDCDEKKAAPALVISILLFGLYWCLTGPVGFAVLKSQQKGYYSWVVFAAVVLGFSAHPGVVR